MCLGLAVLNDSLTLQTVYSKFRSLLVTYRIPRSFAPETDAAVCAAPRPVQCSLSVRCHCPLCHEECNAAQRHS